MESPLKNSAVFFFLPSLLCIMVFLFQLSRKLSSYPLGPKGLPIIGKMSMMPQMSHHRLAQLAKQYGGLLHLQMGLHSVVAISTPDLAREVLQAQDSVFANRSSSFAATYLSYASSNLSIQLL